MIGALRGLASLAADVVEAAVFAFDGKDAAAALRQETALLTEIASHLGAIRALLEDTRNLIAHDPSAAVRPVPCGPATEDAPRGTEQPHTRAGHPKRCMSGFSPSDSLAWLECTRPAGHMDAHSATAIDDQFITWPNLNRLPHK